MPTSPPEPPEDARFAATLLELLRPAFEPALDVVRAHGSDPAFPKVPATLRPVLRFAKVPLRSAAVVRNALEDAPALREAIAGHLDGDRLGRTQWLWFHRPDGWRDELESIVTEIAEEDRAAAVEVARRSAELELRTATDRLLVEQERRAALERSLAGASSDVDSLRSEVERLSVLLDEARARAESAVDERNRAVRQLKETERHLGRRVEEVRDLTALLRSGAEAGTEAIERDVPVDPVDRVRAAELVDEVGRRLAELRALVAPTDRIVLRDSRAGPASDRSPGRGRASGLIDDSPEGLRSLLSLPGAVLVVDGYNVTQQRWPSLAASGQREALERGLVTLRRATGAEVRVVWDGDLDGADPSRRTGSEIRVSFTTADVEADDDIIADVARTVQAARSSGRAGPVVAVSDDRRVRRGVTAAGGTAVAVASLVANL